MSPLWRKVRRLALLLSIAYIVVAVLVWSQQSRMLYPAPQEVATLPDGFAEVGLTTSDGLTLRAFHGEATEGRPTIVYFHGNGGSLSGAIIETRRMAEAGYGLMLVEYRGYGGNPGEPAEQGFYNDGRAAMSYLAATGLEPGQVILAGHSLGSGVATHLASEYPVRAVVLSAPYTTLQDVAAERMWWLPVRLLMHDRFDSLAKVATLETPLLVVHGTQDDLIPVGHGRTLADTALQADFVAMSGYGHDLSFRLETQDVILDWLDRLNHRS